MLDEITSPPGEPSCGSPLRIGGAALYLGDALAGMAALPGASFDLAVVDPPYGASSSAEWKLDAEHDLAGFGGAWRLAGHEWDRLAGRPDTGTLATQVPDLTLRLAEETARLRLPAAIIPAALLFLTQDYWHEVDARFADDWPAMVRGAAGIESRRIEDYVAALGSRGPLRPR